MHDVVMGRKFLRETRALDTFRHRLTYKPAKFHDVPIVAFLGGQDEALKFWLDEEELKHWLRSQCRVTRLCEATRIFNHERHNPSSVHC